MGAKKTKTRENEVRNFEAVSSFEIVSAFALRVQVGIAVKLRRIEVTALPMKLPLRNPMHLTPDSEVT
jgi:hypothetical protein